MATPHIPSEADVLQYFTNLSNWGRWGDDDQLGTLNLVTAAKRTQAAGLVREGLTVRHALLNDLHPPRYIVVCDISRAIRCFRRDPAAF